MKNKLLILKIFLLLAQAKTVLSGERLPIFGPEGRSFSSLVRNFIRNKEANTAESLEKALENLKFIRDHARASVENNHPLRAYLTAHNLYPEDKIEAEITEIQAGVGAGEPIKTEARTEARLYGELHLSQYSHGLEFFKLPKTATEADLASRNLIINLINSRDEQEWLKSFGYSEKIIQDLISRISNEYKAAREEIAKKTAKAEATPAEKAKSSESKVKLYNSYEEYIKECKQKMKEVHEHLAADVTGIVESFACISEDQWIKNRIELGEAIQRNEIGRVRELLKTGIETGEIDIHSALITAADSGNLEVIKLLVPHANAEAIYSAFNYNAIYRGNLEVIKFLLSHGADINSAGVGGKTPLMFALDYGNLEVIKLLVSLGADINAKDSSGDTILIHALNLLLFIVKETPPKGNGPEEYYVPYAKRIKESIDIIRFLLSKGINVNEKGGKGLTPLTFFMTAVSSSRTFNRNPEKYAIANTVRDLLIKAGALP